MKRIFVLISVLLMVLCGCASGGKEETDLDYVKNKKTMIIGITYFEPMDYLDDGDWVGFDADLGRAVCEKLGVEPVFQEISWEAKETELSSRTIDCIWNGLTYTDERAENMSMSDYYMLNKQVLAVRKDRAEDFKSSEDLKDASIAVETGSAGEELAVELFGDTNIVGKSIQLDALTELLAGTADVAILDYTMAYYLFNKADGDFKNLQILDGVIEAESEYYAIAFRKGSNLTAEVNEIIKGFKADGTIKNIAAKYGLEEAIVY